MLKRPRLTATAVAVSVFVLVVSIAAEPASAQRRGRIDRRLLKNSPELLEAVSAMAAPASASTVRILVNEEPAALGTIVGSDGYVLTKASELDEAGFTVELPDGSRLPGKITGVLKEHDLAAVKVEATGLTPATFSAAAVNAADAGQWLYSTGVGRDGVLALGNLSVPGLRRIPGSGSLLGVRLDNALLGIPVHAVDPGGAAERAGLKPGDLIMGYNQAPVSTMRDFVRVLRSGPPNATYRLAVSRGGKALEIPLELMNGQAGVTLETQVIGVPVAEVTPGSGAAEAGVEVGDIVIALDERPVRDTGALMAMIREYSPGDEVEVTLLRGGQEQTLVAKLGYRSGRSQRGDIQNSLGSTLSARAVDFPAVLQHDSILHANQMGGPLVNLKGEVVGINIARAGRVETFALPAQVIEAAIPELLSGKLPTATGPAVTEEGKPPVQQELGEE
jgi:S1-C subfamily serine protease